MAEDFEAFAVDRGYDPDLIELRRVALTLEQITREGIPPYPKGFQVKELHSTRP
jgi:hypothetical protein